MVDLDDLAGEGPGGRVRKVRRALGARAFGFNYYTLGPNEDGREHDHAEQPQEEVYFVVRGSGRMRIDEEEIELLPGRFVRVDAESRRLPHLRRGRTRVRHVRGSHRRQIRAARVGLAAKP